MRWLLYLTAMLCAAEAKFDRAIVVPVAGAKVSDIRDSFNEARGNERRHEATDIMAPRGTQVLAADDGTVAKLFLSKPGGMMIYEFDPTRRFCYYYAHLDAYAQGLKEGTPLKRGEVIGYVGTTGNAPPNAPHLHFAILVLGPEKSWYRGTTAIDPYPFLRAAAGGETMGHQPLRQKLQ